MSTAVVTVEGVLRTTIGNRIIPEGARLYRALKSVGQVVLITISDIEQVQRWMTLEGLPMADNISVLADDVESCGLNAYSRALAHLRGVWHYDVDLVVDSDPDYVALAINRGYNTLLFTHAQYAHPDWRPSADKNTPWADMVEIVHRDLTAKANDKRLQDEDE